MKTLSRIALASSCAALVMMLAGCRSPIMTDRWASDGSGANAAELHLTMHAAG